MAGGPVDRGETVACSADAAFRRVALRRAAEDAPSADARRRAWWRRDRRRLARRGPTGAAASPRIFGDREIVEIDVERIDRRVEIVSVVVGATGGARRRRVEHVGLAVAHFARFFRQRRVGDVGQLGDRRALEIGVLAVEAVRRHVEFGRRRRVGVGVADVEVGVRFGA